MTFKPSVRRIEDFEDYTITRDGIVISLKRSEPVYLKGDISDGYKRVVLHNKERKKRFFVHRLVAETFIDNLRNKPLVNHIDSDRLNNKVENLEWCTAQENVSHCVRCGRFNPPSGEKHYLSKVTEEQVKEIRRDRATGMTYTELEEKYPLTRASIFDIIHRITWKRLK